MRTLDAALRLLFFLPLIAAAVLVGPGSANLPGGPAPLASALFGIGLFYARFAALIRGRHGLEEAALGLQVLPFLAWLAMRAAGLGADDVLLLSAEWLLSGSLLYALEALLVPRLGGFAPVLVFGVLTGGAAFAIATLPALPLMAATALGIIIIAWISARRRG